MRSRFFMQILASISFSDMVASTASAFGFPSSDSRLCAAQSFLVAWFYRATFLWTLILTYQLHSVVLHGKVALKQPFMLLLGWALPCILALIPFTFTKYGRPSSSEGLGWCYFSDSKTLGEIWIELFWFLDVLFCFTFMMYFYLRVYWRFRDNLFQNSRIYDLVNALYPYPLTLFFTWMPLVMFTVCQVSGFKSDDSPYISQYLAAFSIQNGTILAIIFFWKSHEARNLWLNLVCGRQRHPLTIREEFDDTVLEGMGCDGDGDSAEYSPLDDNHKEYRGVHEHSMTDEDSRTASTGSGIRVIRPPT